MTMQVQSSTMIETRIAATTAHGQAHRQRSWSHFRPMSKGMRPASGPQHQTKPASHEYDTPVVFVVDNDVSVRDSLGALIRSAGWQAETFAAAQEFLARPRVFVPSCLVVDATLPGLNGLDLQKRIADRTEMPIIFIARDADVPMSVQAMKAGALEFFMKPLRDDVLLGAIGDAIEHSQMALGHGAQVQALRERHASLTPREREVMALVASGLLNKQVGAELGISEITVKAHRGKVMQKMQAGSFATLVTMATELAQAI